MTRATVRSFTRWGFGRHATLYVASEGRGGRRHIVHPTGNLVLPLEGIGTGNPNLSAKRRAPTLRASARQCRHFRRMRDLRHDLRWEQSRCPVPWPPVTMAIGSGMDRLFITLGALSGFLAVAAGAFGAHALRDRLTGAMLDVFQTGVTYQMYHALALVGVGILLARFSIDGSAWLTAAGWLFVGGSVLFSGSLYALSLTGTTWLGAITPLGGLAFLAGWLAVAIGIWR
jgi:uncharacterized membrane protein YgdD (TMEM256/DUF423 family)